MDARQPRGRKQTAWLRSAPARVLSLLGILATANGKKWTCSWDTVTLSEGQCAVNISSVHPSELEEWQAATDSITTCSEQDLTVTDPTSTGGCAPDSDTDECQSATAHDAPGRALCSPVAFNFSSLEQLQAANDAFTSCKDGASTEGCEAAAVNFYLGWTSCADCGTFDYQLDQGQMECAQHTTAGSCNGAEVTGVMGSEGPAPAPSSSIDAASPSILLEEERTMDAVCVWGESISPGACVAWPTGPDAQKLGELTQAFAQCIEQEISVNVGDGLSCSSSAPETCGTFGLYCIPKTAKFPSMEEFEALLHQTEQCEPTLQGSATAIATALTPECDAWREQWLTMLGCPECVDEDNARAAATPTCHAITSEAECDAALFSNSRASAVPVEPSGADGELATLQRAPAASLASDTASSVGMRQLATAVVSVVCAILA